MSSLVPNPSLHPYASPQAHTRLLLLIAVLAQNPGIGDRRTDAKDRDAMDVIQDAMVELAAEQGLEYERYSPAALRLDVRYLKARGVMPKGTTLHRGYYLGKKTED